LSLGAVQLTLIEVPFPAGVTVTPETVPGVPEKLVLEDCELNGLAPTELFACTLNL
jgi:hypothetical protein